MTTSELFKKSIVSLETVFVNCKDSTIIVSMITSNTFREMALSFPGTEENPHFDRTAFRVSGSKIFATMHERSNSANFKFSISDQFVFCQYDNEAVYPVKNKWGDKGWTTFKLDLVPKELVLSALEAAYSESTGSGKKK